MHASIKAGSNLPLEIVTLEPVSGADGRQAAHGEVGSRSLGGGSFTTTYQWRGNGTVLLNLRHGAILAGSRVFASVSEYNTAWNVDRFIGNATIQVLNVSPYNGGVWVRLACGWSSPLNNSISLLIDP